MDTIAPDPRGSVERPTYDNVAYTVASKNERAWAAAVAAVVALFAAVVAPFGYAQAVQVTAFVPAFSAAAFVAMALTATLLFAQYRAGRYLPLAILALAYVSSALLSLLYVLTFPLVFSPTGLLGAGSQTAAWLHLGWHVLFCVLVALYVVADSGAFAEKSWFTFRRLAFCVATLVVAFGTFATLGHDALPVIIRDGKHTALFNTFVAPFVVGTLFFTTVFLIAVTRLRTRSHLWLSVVLLAILVETIMVSYESGGRYSYGWYCARVELAAGSIIFLMMLQIQYTAILRRVTLSNSRLEERNAQVEEFIELQKNIAAALPSRARVVDIILDFALQCTAGDGSVMESLQDDEIVYEAAKGTMAPYVGMRKPRSRSLSALSVDLGEALYSSDTSTDLRVFGARSQQLNIGSMIVVPIPISPSVTIVLKVTSQRRSAFAAADISTLQLAATNLSSGLRAAEEFTELEAAELDQRLYARQLRALHVIASTTTVESENQVDEALRLVLEQLDLDWAYLGILDYATNELKIDRSVSGHGARVLEVDNRIPLSSIGIAGVTRADGVFVVDDAAALSDCPLYGGWSSYIAVPLRIAGVRYGAIGFTSRRVRNAAFSEGNAKFVAVAGELIASAIAAKIKKEQLAASEMRYRALTDAMPQLVWVIDAKAKLHYVNERWSTYTGLDMHQSAAIAGDIIVGSEFRTIIANHSDTSPLRDFECEVRLRRYDATYRWHLVRGVPFGDDSGHVRRWIVTGADIEERKAAEAAYSALHEAALAATEAKSRFLATMSHEIRTPMNGVIGMTELLLSTQLSSEQNEYTQIVYDSGRSLLRLLNDILDYSKIEAGKLELETIEFELPKQIDSVAHLMRSQFESKAISFSMSIDPSIPECVMGDPGRLRQILINLIGNALKFTPSGGSVHVIVTSEGTEANRVPIRVLVEDTGIGMQPDVVERLFQPFAQGDDSTTRKYGGTGLGLSICSQLVSLMSGTIGVESTVGQGSSFWFCVDFTLPAASQVFARVVLPAREIEYARGRAGKILLVEDNDINTRLAVAQFKKIGFDIGVAVNGRRAVEAVQREKFDLVFMDCQMPEMDGFAATSEIRRLESGTFRRLPIVAMTADARHEDHERCLAAGMDDYLSKPTTLGKLREVVDRWLPPVEIS